jgi:arylsulfatase A-like enzyme
LLGDHGMAYKWLMYDPIVHVPLIVRDSRRERSGDAVQDLVSLMDLGPTILSAAGVEVPSYLEGRSLLPYTEGPGEGFAPREWVFCEDNYQVMMRGERHKMVYYIGQDQGELYDLEQDPHELWNLWDGAEHRDLQNELLARLLRWLASSTYYNAGYRRQRSRQYGMRWPSPDNAFLHGAQGRPVPRSFDL